MPEWIGKTIGKVRIEKLLARGGMAEVYLGTHLTLERPVAIKLLHSHIEAEPMLLERFQREARVVAGLRHPNIVQIFDFDTIDGHPYIVMEYLKGPTLANYLRGLHARNERIPPHQVARLLKALTAAIDYAHEQGVIHRDIKPGNIMLLRKGDDIPLDEPLTNDVEAIVTDFGLVRIANAATQTASGLVSGTPAYMSPEQAQGEKIDHHTDIYSLGVVLYEMLAGRVPFEADSTLSVIYMHIHSPPPPIAGITPAVQAVLTRALAKDPDERYQTSREMAVDFFLAIGMTAQAETIMEVYPGKAGATATSIPASTTSKKPKPVRSRLWVGAGIFSFICLGLLGAGALGLRSFLPFAPKTPETLSPTVTDPTTAVVLPVTGDLPEAEGMVEVGAGKYEVGLSPADDYHVAPITLTLKDFWIDKYQITNEQYQQYLTATGAPPPQVWPGAGDHPVRGVTWEAAQAYCGWLKKRLPSEAEWEAAGRGAGPQPPLYPWGNDATASGQIAGLPDEDTYPVGTLTFNQSPFGVFDLMGNVWEWVGDPYAQIPEGYKLLRGGRFGLPLLDLAYRFAVTPDDTRYVKYAGFRCAAGQVK
ncbi:MAG TPA: bifunctional serine/threonine-protein kinase/formylglycine-generating enzyme family protein [Anaerolineales bacterium]|nr:bifunctional serine/threonine-protein kinase/formylglycine-generating enzyme family protein [Anaerolineales bacterium]